MHFDDDNYIEMIVGAWYLRILKKGATEDKKYGKSLRVW